MMSLSYTIKLMKIKQTKMYHLIKNSFSYLTLNKNNYPRDKSSIFQQKTAKPFESVLSQINYTVNTGNITFLLYTKFSFKRGTTICTYVRTIYVYILPPYIRIYVAVLNATIYVYTNGIILQHGV